MRTRTSERTFSIHDFNKYSEETNASEFNATQNKSEAATSAAAAASLLSSIYTRGEKITYTRMWASIRERTP